MAKIVISAVNKELDDYAKKMETVVRAEAHVDTGAVRDSISTEKKGEGHYLVGVDAAKLKGDPRNKTGIDYSPFYHDGHGPYTVTAKRGKALKWVGKDGKVHFAKKVHIPAHAGDPFIERAVARRPKLK